MDEPERERPSEHEEALITGYAEVVMDFAKETADLLAERTGVQIEAVALTIRTAEGWGGTQIVAPDDWGEREECALVLTAAKHYVEQAGGSMTLVDDRDARVRPMRRRRRPRHR